MVIDPRKDCIPMWIVYASDGEKQWPTLRGGTFPCGTFSGDIVFADPNLDGTLPQVSGSVEIHDAGSDEPYEPVLTGINEIDPDQRGRMAAALAPLREKYGAWAAQKHAQNADNDTCVAQYASAGAALGASFDEAFDTGHFFQEALGATGGIVGEVLCDINPA